MGLSDALATWDKAGKNAQEKIHEIKIKVLTDKIIPFEYICHWFKENPAKYFATNWYVGNIILVGKLVK